MKKTSARKSAKTRSPTRRKWSAEVTETSHALELKKGAFKSNHPREIARAVKRALEASSLRRASPYRSAVSMISFYENRGGKNLSPGKRRVLQQAKKDLKEEFPAR